MSLGQNIYSLRTAREMSQLELAEHLGVSRQSISKWETDASTPELEKLIKLSQLFGVSLDELVKDDVNSVGRDDPGAPHESASEPQYIYTTPKRQTRKIVGIILLCMAFLCVLLLGVLGEFIGGCIIALPFAICGIICLCVKRLPGLWCVWAVYFLVTLYLQSGTGISWTWSFNTYLMQNAQLSIHMIVAWGILAVMLGLCLTTAYCLRTPHIDLRTAWKKPLIIVLVLIVLRIGLHFLMLELVPVLMSASPRLGLSAFNLFCSILRTTILTALLTLASRCIRWKK